VTASVESPTGPPSNFSTIESSSSRASRSRPCSSISSSVSASRAISVEIEPSWRTCATSRTRRRIRFAIRGVPRERRAISTAPSGLMATFSTPAPRVTIVVSSACV